MLPRIGMVVFRSTTPCVRFSSWSRSNFFTLNSIAGVPPLAQSRKSTGGRARIPRLLRRATLPCFMDGIKIVVVAVAVEMRKSRAPPNRATISQWTVLQETVDSVEESGGKPHLSTCAQKFSSPTSRVAQDQHRFLRRI